ncbi:MAG: DUF4386 family protein [Bacteroidetes bacterium]|nr:DUF4386 family protein [Bacteroidota bacterium]MCL5030640.1 DUF4386 family protein [Bacteroidota bacterium]
MSSQNIENEEIVKQWKSIYKIGAITTIIVLGGIIIDIVIGSSSGGNLTLLPQTAIERFEQFQHNWLMGLYNLDLLNAVNQIILIPTYYALYAAHRNIKPTYSFFALIIFLVGTILFISNNTALPMYELSIQYFKTTSESTRLLMAAAGEAMLAKGAHGSLSAFVGFLLPTVGGIVMSFVMLRGKIFTRINSYLGVIGNILLTIYIFLVTFMPQTKEMATVIAAPGGLFVMGWMILFTKKLFSLAK